MEEKTIKKIVGAIVIVLIFTILITGIGYNWTYVWGTMTGHQFYTEEQYKQNYDNGYDEGLGQYKPLIKQLREVEDLLNKSQIKVNELTDNDKLKTARIAELEKQIADKTARIIELENKSNSDEQELSSLRVEKAQLQSEKEMLIAEKEELQITIESLQNQVITFQNEIARLTGLIESYEEIANGTYEISFYNGNKLLTAKAVKKGEKLDKSLVPTYDFIDGRKFLGWSIDNENLIDVSEQNITGKTSFNVVLGNYFWNETIEEKVGQEIDSLNSFVSLQNNIFTLLVKSADNKKLFVLEINDLDEDGVFQQSDLGGIKESYKIFNKASEIISVSNIDDIENSDKVYIEVLDPNFENNVLVNVYTIFEDKVILKNCICQVDLSKWANQSDSEERAILVAMGLHDYNGYRCGDFEETEFIKSDCY